MERDTEKGKRGGKCNRTACNNEDAWLYNESTRMYYCEKCAILINRACEHDYKDGPCLCHYE